ncbi:MAG: hypothetical protein AAFY97_02050 [Pseudomonadota bacterium]
MTRILTGVCAIAFLSVLSACSGTSPFLDGTVDPNDPNEPDADLLFERPPGTTNPSPSSSITRFEPDYGTGVQGGDNRARDFTYDATADTFTVDNLAFDGSNVYQRGTAVAGLQTTARVYESDAVFPDTFPTPDTPIRQFPHRLVAAETADGSGRYAIVRTSQYVNYGFGGFIYERNGSVVLPTSGQASYSGEYNGLRDFNGKGGLEYVTGDMSLAIDFEDFNDGNGVVGSVTNRRFFDLNGNDVTQDYLDDLTDALGAPQGSVPDIQWVVGPGVMDENGEIIGSVFTQALVGGGTIEQIGEGIYYAIISGDNAENVIGIITLEENLGDFAVRETGGFILERP